MVLHSSFLTTSVFARIKFTNLPCEKMYTISLKWTLLEGIIEPTEAAAATTDNAAATVAEAEVVRQDILEFQPPFRPEMVEHPLNVNILKKLVPSLT